MNFAGLEEWYAGRFRQIGPGHLRTVGREAEIPLVTEDGEAGIAMRIWPRMIAEGWEPVFDEIHQDLCVGVKDAKGNSISTDAGICTLEVSTRPCGTLFELERECESIFGLLAHASQKEGMRILGYGIQPVTAGERYLWAPKARYTDGVIPSLGEPVHAVTVTASDQCQVDIGPDEIVLATNVLSALSGSMITLLANSSVYQGKINSSAAHREQIWDTFAGCERRVGVPIDPFLDLEQLLDAMINERMLFRFNHKRNRYELVNERFVQWGQGGFSEEEFSAHEGCIWWSARPRALYGTIEVRPACQQPPSEHMVLHALVLGLVENLRGAADLLRGIPWEEMREHRIRAAKEGMLAAAGRFGDRFLRNVLEAAEAGLALRGKGEARFLAPLFDRLRDRRAPADLAIQAFSKEGPKGIVDVFSYKTG